MKASPRAHEIATELAKLTANQLGHSKFIQQLGDACNQDVAEAASLYQSLDMWGGMGSFADEAGVELDAEGKTQVNQLLIELYEEFERQGIHFDRASSWVDAFRMWRDMDVFRNPSA